MLAYDCLKTLREIKDVAFATADESGRAQVRIIDVMIVEGERLYFVTSRGKDFHRQLTASGEVAITGMTKDYVMIRVNGNVKKMDAVWVDRVFEANPSMNGVYPGDSRRILDAFCLHSGYGEYFDLSGHPIKRESFAFGGGKAPEKGFEIGENCTECGVCADVCPQKCIEAGSPYAIAAGNCLHCGLCREECPVDAIARLGE